MILNTEQLHRSPALSPSLLSLSPLLQVPLSPATMNFLEKDVMNEDNLREFYLNAITDVERAAATNETTTVNDENNWSDAETNRESYMPDETINSQQSRTNDQLTTGAHLITQNLNSQQCSPNSESHGKFI